MKTARTIELAKNAMFLAEEQAAAEKLPAVLRKRITDHAHEAVQLEEAVERFQMKRLANRTKQK